MEEFVVALTEHYLKPMLELIGTAIVVIGFFRFVNRGHKGALCLYSSGFRQTGFSETHRCYAIRKAEAMTPRLQ